MMRFSVRSANRGEETRGWGALCSAFGGVLPVGGEAEVQKGREKRGALALALSPRDRYREERCGRAIFGWRVEIAVI